MSGKMTMDEWLDLPFSHDYLFYSVMKEVDIAMDVLSLLDLGISLGDLLDFQQEKTIKHNDESKGIRMDVFLRDEEKIVNLEMQTSDKKDFPQRSRYYCSQIDQNTLGVGAGYSELPDAYVIFICTFDPFGEGKPVYVIERNIDQRPFQDGTHIIFINASAYETVKNPDLREFLQYTMGELDPKDICNKVVQRIYDKLLVIKANNERRMECMKYEYDKAMLKAEGYKLGEEEGIAKGIVKGREEGIAKGLAKGEQSKSYEIARNLLDVLDNAVIAVKTGLSIQQVEALRGSSV